MKKFVVLFALLFLSTQSIAAGPKLDLEAANNDILDTASLQRGAILFATKCMSCHSVKYMRYNRVARDLGWTDEEVLEKMKKPGSKVVDNMMSSMSPKIAKMSFGTEVPDLSLMARLKGTDYIYTFLRSFEFDKTKGKFDNKILPGTVMPNIMPMPPEGTEMRAKYDEEVKDLSNFLEYVGEPAKTKRLDLGWKVMLFLFILFVVLYLLKKEYWRDVQH